MVSVCIRSTCNSVQSEFFELKIAAMKKDVYLQKNQADSAWAPAGTGESWAHMSLSAVLGGKYNACNGCFCFSGVICLHCFLLPF